VDEKSRIKTISGKDVEIIDRLGEGAQGIVYRVRCDGRELALKWYFPNKFSVPLGYYENIRSNIEKGAPTKAFLWPLEITEFQDGDFGYLMELRPPGYREFSQFLLARERFSGVGAIINAAICIAGAFRALHNKGYSYQDLNDGNFFIDPKTGDVLICDNDNVAPYGESLGVLGKCRYVAPEIVVGRKRPDIHTDRFSLAVVLFMLLFYNHPLEGKKTLCPCLTDELEHKFYGTEPVFLYDPTDTSNLPVRGVHNNTIVFWPLYPAFIRQTFIDAFDKSRLIGADIEHRVTEREWQDAFLALRDVTVKCECGGETFLEIDKPQSKCINCGRTIPRPPLLKLGKREIALYPGNKLYKRHIDTGASDYNEPIGEVVRSKFSPDVWGVRNISDTEWIGESPSGERRSVEKGASIPIKYGFRIDFGGTNAEITGGDKV
jgi:serine/threonine protein kinase